MGYRNATCNACKTTSKVSDNSSAERAKCGKCGGPLVLGAVVSEGASTPMKASPKTVQPARAGQAQPAARTGAGSKSGARVPAAEKPAAKKMDPKFIAIGVIVFVAVDIGIYFAWQNNVEAKKSAEAKPESGTSATAKPEAGKPDAGKPAVPAPAAAGLPTYAANRDTSPARWTELQALTASFADGAAAAPAGTVLVGEGTTLKGAAKDAEEDLTLSAKDAFPAIVNHMSKLNLEDGTDFRKADALRQLLEYNCPYAAIPWKGKDQPDWLDADKKAVKAWSDTWKQVISKGGTWAKLTKEASQTVPAKAVDTPGATPPEKK